MPARRGGRRVDRLTRDAVAQLKNLADMVETTPAFQRWNRRLYDPLCVTLAVLVAVGRRNRS